jgi:hypothetical protein
VEHVVNLLKHFTLVVARGCSPSRPSGSLAGLLFYHFYFFCTRRGQLNVKEDAAAPPPNVTAVRFKIHDYFTEEVT